MSMTGGIGYWRVKLDESVLSASSGDAVPGETTEADGFMTTLPQGLGLPEIRTEDVTYLQRDGVRMFSDWYTNRIITIEEVVVTGSCKGCTPNGRIAKRKTREIYDAWGRHCDDAELVIYTDCHKQPEPGETAVDRSIVGPFGIVGRPRVAETVWDQMTGAATMTLRFDARDHRMFVLDPDGTPGSGERCSTLNIGSSEQACRSLPLCFDTYPGGASSELADGSFEDGQGIWTVVNPVVFSLGPGETPPEGVPTEAADGEQYALTERPSTGGALMLLSQMVPIDENTTSVQVSLEVTGTPGVPLTAEVTPTIAGSTVSELAQRVVVIPTGTTWTRALVPLVEFTGDHDGYQVKVSSDPSESGIDTEANPTILAAVDNVQAALNGGTVEYTLAEWDFEATTDPWTPRAGDQYAIELDDSHVRSGESAMHVIGYDGFAAYLNITEEVEPGAEYIFSIWCYSPSESDRAPIVAVAGDGVLAFSQDIATVRDQWVELRVSFQTRDRVGGHWTDAELLAAEGPVQLRLYGNIAQSPGGVIETNFFPNPSADGGVNPFEGTNPPIINTTQGHNDDGACYHWAESSPSTLVNFSGTCTTGHLTVGGWYLGEEGTTHQFRLGTTESSQRWVSDEFTCTGEWDFHSYTFTGIPVEDMEPMWLHPVYGSNGEIRADDFSIADGDVAADFNGDTEDTEEYAYEWVGEQYNSASTLAILPGPGAGLWYDDGRVTSMSTESSAGVWCFSGTKEGARGPGRPVQVDVGGALCVHPTITLHGQLTDPFIEDMETGMKIGYEGTISNLQTVVIDTDEGTAVTGGADVTYKLTGDPRFSIGPEDTQLRLSSYGEDDNGWAEICWRPMVPGI